MTADASRPLNDSLRCSVTTTANMDESFANDDGQRMRSVRSLVGCSRRRPRPKTLQQAHSPGALVPRLSSLALSLVAVVAATPVTTAAAQNAFDAKSAKHLLDEYVADMDTVHTKIVALAKAIPPEKYSWR